MSAPTGFTSLSKNGHRSLLLYTNSLPNPVKDSKEKRYVCCELEGNKKFTDQISGSISDIATGSLFICPSFNNLC